VSALSNSEAFFLDIYDSASLALFSKVRQQKACLFCLLVSSADLLVRN